MKRANLICAITFVIGVAGLQTYAYQLKKSIQGGEPVRVLIVTRDLGAGALLSSDNLSVIDVPSDYVDARRIVASERANLLGVGLQTRLRAGESLVWSDLADGAAHRHLASLVLPGKRAYTLSAKANPLGQLLRVGDHVDVLLDVNGKSSVLLERILVLAVGGRMEIEESSGKSSRRFSSRRNQGVTLSLDAEQSQEIFAAESRGDLRLVLRHPEDLHKKEKVAALVGPKKRNRNRKSGASKESESPVKTRSIEHVR